MVTISHIPIDKYLIPIMVIKLSTHTIINVPTQIGCPIRCTFCISSKSKFVRNLTTAEISSLIDTVDTSRPFVISFTGEGEPLLNLRAVNAVMNRYDNFENLLSYRICFSGFESVKLKSIRIPKRTKVDLQFSMHSTCDTKRSELVHNTDSLKNIIFNIHKNSSKFNEIAINYVLIKGFNDSVYDRNNLITMLDHSWIIKLNPLITENGSIEESPHKKSFEFGLKAFFENVKSFSKIGSSISNGFYEELTYKLQPTLS